MYECINCGNLFLTGARCPECGGTAIEALDREAAIKEYTTKLQHHGIDMDRTAIERLVDAALEA